MPEPAVVRIVRVLGRGMPMVSSMNQDRTAARQLYKLLLKRFGRQDWWPAESHFEMMAGAILVQHTAWRNVDTSLRGLKAAGLLSQGALAQVSEEELACIVRPSGFMKSKSRALKGLASWLVNRGYTEPDMMPSRDPDLREELLALPGIGNETADVIRLYAFGQKCFIWDAYALRMLRALGLASWRNYDQALRHQGEFIDLDDFTLTEMKEYHGLIVTAGKEAGQSGDWDFLTTQTSEASGR